MEVEKQPEHCFQAVINRNIGRNPVYSTIFPANFPANFSITSKGLHGRGLCGPPHLVIAIARFILGVETLNELSQARENLIREIVCKMPNRHFLISVKRGEPDWALLNLPDAENLPTRAILGRFCRHSGCHGSFLYINGALGIDFNERGKRLSRPQIIMDGGRRLCAGSHDRLGGWRRWNA
jgi:hypothetical protein